MLGDNQIPTKRPEAHLDYTFDFAPQSNNRGSSDWLKPGEKIDSAEIVITPEGSMTYDNLTLTDGETSVTVWLDGGIIDTTYKVKCSIETDSIPSRKDYRIMEIVVKE